MITELYEIIWSQYGENHQKYPENKKNDDPAFGFFHDEFPQWVTLRVAYDDITIVIILNIRNEQTLS